MILSMSLITPHMPNTRLKIDVANARLSGSLVRHGLAAER
jgi:hypothetical protein